MAEWKAGKNLGFSNSIEPLGQPFLESSIILMFILNDTNILLILLATWGWVFCYLYQKHSDVATID